MSIVAVFSQGDDDNLMIGRNGIFYDRKGRDFDATISKILASPISLRQAFWSPYKKLVRLIEEQVAKRAADADADVNNTLTTVATAPAAAPTKLKFDPSVIALISVALGSLAAAFAGVLAFLGKFDPWEICLRRDHAGHLRSFADSGVHQIAQTQPGADSGRERLGGERQGQDQRAARHEPDENRQTAGGFDRGRGGGQICRAQRPVAEVPDDRFCHLVDLRLCG
jgi:hypothetical protein